MHQRKCSFRCLGFLICLLAASTLGLGIADVVINVTQCQANPCEMTNGLILTWVAVGIWASIPVFITGLSLIHHSRKQPEAPLKRNSWLALLLFMSAIFFTAAILGISIAEVILKFPAGAPTMQSPPATQAMFALPIAIAVHGFILHLLTLHLFVGICCCKKHTKEATYVQGQGLPANACSHQQEGAVDKMNIWSAYRWMNGGPQCDRGCGGAAAKPAAAASYYSGGAPPTRCFHVGGQTQAASCCHNNNVASASSCGCGANTYQQPRQVLTSCSGPAPRW